MTTNPLAIWLEREADEPGWGSRVRMADELSMVPATITRWCSEGYLPTLAACMRIKEYTRGAVAAEDFVEARKRALKAGLIREWAR